MKTPRPVLALPVFLLLSLLAGCSPVRFEVTVGSERPLAESVVAGRTVYTTHKIALIDVQGLIAPAPPPSLLGAPEGIVENVVRRLEIAALDRNVKAVVLRIDSPGGAVTTSDVLYEEIVRFRERSGKPVIASMGALATSGAYYAALACDEIIAEPTTITGSIGVILASIDASEGMDRLGVRSNSIVSGPNKDLLNPIGPENAEHRAILQQTVDDLYERFRSLVRTTRTGIAPQRFDELTDGRVIAGVRAKELGLVDRNGSLRDAYARAQELAGLDGAKLIRYHTAGRLVETPYTAQLAPSGPVVRVEPFDGLASWTSRLRPGVPYAVWMP